MKHFRAVCFSQCPTQQSEDFAKGVAQRGCNHTGPPWCRMLDRKHNLAKTPGGRLACPPAALQMTTTDDSDR